MGSWGGDSLTQDLNVGYNEADTTWVMIAGCLVWLMIPGIGIFYAGLARKKHAITLVWEGMAVLCVVFFQWFFWGYSFTFSHEAGTFWGKLDNFALMKVLAEPSVGSSAVPDIVFMFFQGQFACVTAIILVGGAHERARLGPLLVFVFIWITIVYCPIAEWTWNPSGWLSKLGALDFAGGGPVHMSSGVGALAYSLICGKRKDPAALDKVPMYKPGSMLLVVIGTIFLWFGWFGFNGGSTGNASLRSWYAIANTNLAAVVGGLVWMFIDFAKTRKWSTVAICSGALAGLVGITPAAGFVPIYTAVAIGATTAAICNFAGYLKYYIQIDDGLDVFSIHGIGGAVGSILTSFFAADYISHLDGSTIAKGWMNHHFVQLPYQLAAIGAVYGWSFVVTSLLLLIMNYIPYMKLRMSEEDEMLGSDMAQLAEYGMLYESNSNGNEGLFAMGTRTNYEGFNDVYQYRADSVRFPEQAPKKESSPNESESAADNDNVSNVTAEESSSTPHPVAN